MAAILKEFFKYYNLLIDDYADKRVNAYPLMSSPVPVLLIISSYLYFVKKLGPQIMKNRRPMNIDLVIQVYNITQILLCSYCVYKGVKMYLFGGLSFLCGEVDYSDTPEAFDNLNGCYVYLILKMLDLLDTIFFVLRKKQQQVSFLHLYHHTLMLLMVWTAMKYIGGGHGIFFGTLNSFVHVIMYAYYFITNYDKEYARTHLWWKKHLTQLQICQFSTMLLHAALVLFQPNCSYPRVVIYALIPQNFFITAMFWDFYKKAYLSSNSKKSS